MNKKTKRIILIIGLVILLIGSNVATFFFARSFTNGSSKINQMLDLIDSEYYQDVDKTKLIDAAIKGMFTAIGDEYSEYYTKDEFQAMVDALKDDYQGIGVTVSETDEKNVFVVEVFENSPASGVGMQSGDVIKSVDGEEMLGKGMTYAVSKMKGPDGTKVQITVLRDNVEVPLELTRAKIHRTNVKSEMIDNIGYIIISEISESSGADFKNHLDQCLSKGAKGIILDLRNNGGGLVDQAVEIVDCILKKDSLVVYTVDKKGNRTEYKCTTDQTLNVPIIVLVNGNTASACEIISGAIQDHQAGKILGEKTFGKGVVQKVIPFNDGTGCKITFSQYFTPSGKNIHKQGITPDIEAATPDYGEGVYIVDNEHDVQLQKALEIIKQ